MELAEYRSYDALGLAELVRSGQLTAAQLLETAMRAIDAANPAINALTQLLDAPRQAARREPSGAVFAGVPFALKDLWTQLAGVPTTNGSRLFADAIADHDSEVVHRYERAGLRILGKTASPEFGLSPSTEPALTGPTRNPWDLARSAGGSSGGAAAAVAAGIFPMAHASDGGGSIRIPASCCGLFGLKPTRARITAGPERGEGWNGLSTQHVVSRSVRDSAAALDATAGTMPGDPYAAPPAAGSYLTEVGTAPGALRIGVCVLAPTGAAVDDACRAAAEATARRCEALGHRILPVSWPFGPDDLAAAQASIVPCHVARAVDVRLGQLGRALQPDDLEPWTAAIVAAGRSVSGVAYVSSVQAMHELGRSMSRLFSDIDVLLTPTLGSPPPPLGLLDTSDPGRFAAAVRTVTPFTMIANITGQPAMSVPLDWTDEGLPVGSQFVGALGDEATLFRLAGQLEQAHPWFDRVPPLP